MLALVLFGLLFLFFACVCTHMRTFDVDLAAIIFNENKAFVSWVEDHECKTV